MSRLPATIGTRIELVHDHAGRRRALAVAFLLGTLAGALIVVHLPIP